MRLPIQRVAPCEQEICPTIACNGLVTGHYGYHLCMTAMHNRPTRIAGMEWGTALLAVATCLLFAAGIATITHSVATIAIAAASIAVGVALALRILRPNS